MIIIRKKNTFKSLFIHIKLTILDSFVLVFSEFHATNLCAHGSLSESLEVAMVVACVDEGVVVVADVLHDHAVAGIVQIGLVVVLARDLVHEGIQDVVASAET